MRVFGYARVSTTEQADGGVSLAAQQQQITGYAMMKGWQVADFFVERGVSGSTPLVDRPEGKRLLAAAGKGDVIITSKLDRAFRSSRDALAVLEELKDQGVGLHIRSGRRRLRSAMPVSTAWQKQCALSTAMMRRSCVSTTSVTP